MSQVNLTQDELRKLVGVLGRLGSDHDGERAAAGLVATRILRDRGLSWGDVLQGHGERVRQVAAPAPSSVRPDISANMSLCHRHLRRLNEWEQQFCCSMMTARRRSPKQVELLEKIAASLRARGLD